MTGLSDPTKGALAIVAAAIIWGFQPILYGFLLDVPAGDVAAFRIFWSTVFFTGLLGFQKRIGVLRATFSDRTQFGWTCLAALLVSFNWFFFVYAIQTGRLTESSLGYYIYPLVSVAFGYLFFRERFPPIQWLAFGLMVTGVVVLTLGLGVAPMISLILASTFAMYGIVKKRVAAGPTVSVTGEVWIMTPFALLWIVGFSDVFELNFRQWMLLMLSGPLTGLPLILFAYASQRQRLSTVGLISYLNPTLQFLVAALIFMEPVTEWHGIALVLIWTALALYSASAIRQERKRLASSAATSGTI